MANFEEKRAIMTVNGQPSIGKPKLKVMGEEIMEI